MPTNRAKYEAIAEVVIGFAEEDLRKLNEVERLLAEGEDQAAITAMKTYFNFKKPSQRVLYDRKKTSIAN